MPKKIVVLLQNRFFNKFWISIRYFNQRRQRDSNFLVFWRHPLWIQIITTALYVITHSVLLRSRTVKHIHIPAQAFFAPTFGTAYLSHPGVDVPEIPLTCQLHACLAKLTKLALLILCSCFSVQIRTPGLLYLGSSLTHAILSFLK